MKTASSADDVQAEIERNLQRVYNDILDEAVPDRFTHLLDRLKQAETEKLETDA